MDELGVVVRRIGIAFAVVISLISSSVFSKTSQKEEIYTIKVKYLLTSEEKTFKVRDMSETFQIPLDIDDITCTLGQTTLFKKDNGGVGLQCNTPISNLITVSYLNCLDTPYAYLLLLTSQKDAYAHIKRSRAKPPKGIDINSPNKDILVSSISIRVGCNVLMD